jgi:hypothetical protein
MARERVSVFTFETRETWETRHARALQACRQIILDIVETRQPVAPGDLMPVVYVKSPLLSYDDVLDILRPLIVEGHIARDARGSLVLADHD